VLNALNSTLIAEVNGAMAGFAQDDQVRAILVQGRGRAFSAGFDLKESANRSDASMDDWRAVLERDFDFIMQFWDHPKPTVAAVHGFCLAGAFELSLACDLTVAAEGTRFGEPEVRFGAGIVALLLPWSVGPKKAKELILTGIPIDADEALRIGLVNHVVPADELLPRCEEMAEVFAQRARFALSAAKYLINEGVKLDLEAGLKLEHQVIGRMASKQERAEAVKQAMETQATYANIFSKSKR